MAKKVRVTRKQVDAANAEVKAFRAAGLEPDPLLVRIANARTGRSVLGTYVSTTTSGRGLSEAPST